MNWMGNLLAIAEPMVIFVENSELVDRVLKLREHAKNRTRRSADAFRKFLDVRTLNPKS